MEGKVYYLPEPPPVITATSPETSKRFLVSMDAVSLEPILLWKIEARLQWRWSLKLLSGFYCAVVNYLLQLGSIVKGILAIYWIVERYKFIYILTLMSTLLCSSEQLFQVLHRSIY